jgi:hypothetical protein
MTIKKSLLLSLLPALTFGSAHAGAMGVSSSCCTGFVSLEGGYTRPAINGFDFTTINPALHITSNISRRSWAARLAVGILSMFNDCGAVTAELGWGYYGKTTVTPNIVNTLPSIPITLPNSSFSQSYTISGFDALVGLAYIQPYFTLSAKGGALIQNLVSTTTASAITNPFLTQATIHVARNQTAVLPAIKLGAAYNFNQNWSLIASYYLAVGGSIKTVGSSNIQNNTFDLNIRNQNPTLNTGLLGIQYTV